MSARAILGAGLVKLNVFNPIAQAYGGFGEAFDADKFGIKPNFEEKVSTSKSHLDYGQARASVILPTPTEITIELSASSVEALAMQFQGQVAALSQSSGTLTDAEITLGKIGVWQTLGFRNIAAAGFTVQNQAETVTYVLGTHFEVNWLRGQIRFFPGVAGIPAEEDVIMVNGTYGAVDGKEILGGRVSQVRCQVEFDGKNLADDEPMEADVREAVLGASTEFDFLSSEFSPITLVGKIVTPAGFTEGYVVRFPNRSN